MALKASTFSGIASSKNIFSQMHINSKMQNTTWDSKSVSNEPPFGASIIVYRISASSLEFLILHRAHKGVDFEGDWAWTPPAGARFPKENMKKFLHDIENKGGEGVVVRDSTALYIAKRTSKALKVKSFLDSECEVIGYTKGRGKYEALMGALKCRLPSAIEFKIGSGFSDKERMNPPKIGDIVTFKYKELTKYGKPRFPVFLRVRKFK